MEFKEDKFSWASGATWFKYFSAGDNHEKSPLVVLHGGPGAAHNYAHPIADLLTNLGRPVLLYDQIGCGKSSHHQNAPKDFWTIDLFLTELELLLDHLNIHDDFHLLGHSWGGMLGMEYAVRKPAGLKGLIIADSTPSMELWVKEADRLRLTLPESIQEILTRNEKNGTTDSDEYMAACKVFYDNFLIRVPRSKYSLETAAQRIADPTVYHTMNGPSEFHVTGTLKDWDFVDRLKFIENRTLLLSGSYDESTPLLNEVMLQGIPNASWELFAESSHSPFVEEPAKFSRIVEDFLRGCD
jgi:L-proline amide hydrolase